MEIRLRERFHRFANGLYRSNNDCIINCNPFNCNPFSNHCDTLNADAAFSPNVISNVNYMCTDWISNIDESVKQNVNLIKELIDARNEVK